MRYQGGLNEGLITSHLAAAVHPVQDAPIVPWARTLERAPKQSTKAAKKRTRNILEKTCLKVRADRYWTRCFPSE